MTSHNLGDWVWITGQIERDGWPHRAWHTTDLGDGGVTQAMVVGKRTLANGYVDVIKEDGDGWGPVVTIHQWIPEDHFPAYLVVTDLRTKPFYVRADQIVSDPFATMLAEPQNTPAAPAAEGQPTPNATGGIA